MPDLGVARALAKIGDAHDRYRLARRIAAHLGAPGDDGSGDPAGGAVILALPASGEVQVPGRDRPAPAR